VTHDDHKPDLRVILKWMIAGSGSVITAVIWKSKRDISCCWSSNQSAAIRFHRATKRRITSPTGSLNGFAAWLTRCPLQTFGRRLTVSNWLTLDHDHPLRNRTSQTNLVPIKPEA